MNLPEMLDVTSSQLKRIGYDEETKTLYVEFNTEAIYSYDDVEKSVFEGLRDAESVGSFFIKRIKTQPYVYHKIRESKRRK